MKFRILHILALFGLALTTVHGQVPFTCEGQVWITQEFSNEFTQTTVGSNNSILNNTIKPNIGATIYAMGFRKTDRFIYGIDALTRELYSIDANGDLFKLANLNLDPNLVYLAGAISPNGDTFVVVGSVNGGEDAKIFTIDLTLPNYIIEELVIDNDTRTVDLGFNPISGVMFGYDEKNRQFYTQAVGSSFITKFQPIFFEHNIDGFYFDAFGNMFGLGTALFNSISGLFEVNQMTGETKLISTTGLFDIADVAYCPYSLELDQKVTPEITFPCSDLMLDYTFANRTGVTIQDVNFEHELPMGYSFLPPTNIPLGGIWDNTTADNILRIEGLNIPTGVRTYTFDIYVDEIPKGIYNSQAILTNVPDEYGSLVNSNNPITPATEDRTQMVVNTIDEDSLVFSFFLCEGESFILDASEYGNNLQWSNGETSQLVEVFETEDLNLIAASGCEDLIVDYEIVSASCPFTIELRHMIEPDTLIGCSEAIFRYILENASGEDRFGITLADTLPPEFTFIEVLNDPYDGDLSLGLSPNVFELQNIFLFEGIDTIDVLVNVGESPAGTFYNRGIIKDIHQLLGPTRLSDDPATQAFPDSTIFLVKGFDEVTLALDTFLCIGEELYLDASLYGETFLWSDGSQEDHLVVTDVGDYEVQLLDGCDTATIFYHIEGAEQVQVEFLVNDYNIHQSESITLNPSITNDGENLQIQWNDEMSNSLDCYDCPNPEATPLSDQLFEIYVFNEYCSDTASINIKVNQDRRLYYPNVFVPSRNEINNCFYFQSPDPAEIISFQVFNRWGNQVYQSDNLLTNDKESGWNGRINGELASSGVYVWFAEIRFFDGEIEKLVGDITIIK